MLNRIGFLLVLCLSFGVIKGQRMAEEQVEGVSKSYSDAAKSTPNANADDILSINQSGDAAINIPLFTVQGRELSLPITLNYQAGIKPDQRASEVGLGWSISFGSIVRDYGAFEPDYAETAVEVDMRNYVTGKKNEMGPHGAIETLPKNKYLEYQGLTGTGDQKMTPDLYKVSIPGVGGNTFWNAGAAGYPHDFKLEEVKPWKISHTVGAINIQQEFSRVNELNMGFGYETPAQVSRNRIICGASYAKAITIPPYVGGVSLYEESSNTPMNDHSMEMSNTGISYNDFTQFTITDENGVQYIFGRPLRGQKYLFDEDPYWSSFGAEIDASGVTHGTVYGDFWKIDYIAEWLLTEVRSYNYKDVNSNGIADDGDAGDWIRIEYTDPEEVKSAEKYTWNNCSHTSYTAPKHREWLSYSGTDRASSLMRERAYVTKIVTPTKEYDFDMSQRFDVDHDYFCTPLNRYEGVYIYDVLPFGSSTSTAKTKNHYPLEVMKYDAVAIKDRVSDKSVQTLVFEYAAKGSSKELAVSDYLIINNALQEESVPFDPSQIPFLQTSTFDIENYNYGNKRGKTTLLGIKIYPGQNTSAANYLEYEFDYGFNPSYSELHKHDIIKMAGWPSMRSSKVDNAYPRAKSFNYNPSKFPYWGTKYGYTSSGLMGGTSYYNHALVDAMGYYHDELMLPGYGRDAWSLTKVKIPDGATIDLEYENDQIDLFKCRQLWKASGGLLDDKLPPVINYNLIAVFKGLNQSRLNQYYHLNTKVLPTTFSMEMDMFSAGLRLKSKAVSPGKSGPSVKVDYVYGKGYYPSVPATYWSNYLSAFGDFMRYERENQEDDAAYEPTLMSNSVTYSSGVPIYEGGIMKGNDFDTYLSKLMTGVRVDNTVSDDHFYTYIDEVYSDGSKVRRNYGQETVVGTGVFDAIPQKIRYAKGRSFHIGDVVHVIVSDQSPDKEIVLKSVEKYEANQSNPYESTTYDYNYTSVYRSNTFGAKTLANANHRVYWYDNEDELCFRNTGNPAVTTVGDNMDNVIDNDLYTVANAWLDFFRAINIDALEASWIEFADYEIEGGVANRYHSTLKTLESKINNYKGIESTEEYTYLSNGLLKTKEVENSSYTESGSLIEPSLITKYDYAFEKYSAGAWSNNISFEDVNLLSPVVATTVYKDAVISSNAVAATASTWGYDAVRGKFEPNSSYTYNATLGSSGTLGSFSPFDFNGSNGGFWRWQGSEDRDSYGYPASQQAGDTYIKNVSGYANGLTKATFTFTGERFDATYTGFEDVDYPEVFTPPSYFQTIFPLEEVWVEPDPHNSNTRKLNGKGYTGSSCYYLGLKADPYDAALVTPLRSVKIYPCDPVNCEDINYTASAWFQRYGVIPNGNESELKLMYYLYNSDRSVVLDHGYRIIDLSTLNSTDWVRRDLHIHIDRQLGEEYWLDVQVASNLFGTNGNCDIYVDDLIIHPREALYTYTSYDKFGNPVSVTDANHNTVRMKYDDFGRLLKSYDAEGNLLRVNAYSDFNPVQGDRYHDVIEYIDGTYSNHTRTFMDDLGRPYQTVKGSKEKNSRAVFNARSFDSKGNVSKQYIPTALAYWQQENTSVSEQSLNSYSTSSTVPWAQRSFTELSYNQTPDPRLASQKPPLAPGESDREVKFTDYPNVSGLTVYGRTYGVGELLIQETEDALGRISKKYIDKLGNVVKTIDPIGKPTYAINSTGDAVFDQSYPVLHAITNYEYDAAGNLVSYTDPSGFTTTKSYNSTGGVVTVSSPDAGDSEMRYDRYGRLRFVKNQVDKDEESADANIQHQFKYFKYDDYGNVIEDGVMRSTSINSFNDETTINSDDYPSTQSGKEVHAEYLFSTNYFLVNSKGRLLKETVYNYDALNPSSYTVDDTWYYYNKNGLPRNVSFSLDGNIDYAFKYQYNYTGQPTQINIEHYTTNTMQEPVLQDSYVLQYNYDDWGRLWSSYSGPDVGNLTKDSQVRYDVLGNLQKKSVGYTGVSSDPFHEYQQYSYNIRGELTHILAKNVQMMLTYDDAGKITQQLWSNSLNDQNIGVGSYTTRLNQYDYQYDQKDRLIAANYKENLFTANPFSSYINNAHVNTPAVSCYNQYDLDFVISQHQFQDLYTVLTDGGLSNEAFNTYHDEIISTMGDLIIEHNLEYNQLSEIAQEDLIVLLEETVDNDVFYAVEAAYANTYGSSMEDYLVALSERDELEPNMEAIGNFIYYLEIEKEGLGSPFYLMEADDRIDLVNSMVSLGEDEYGLNIENQQAVYNYFLIGSTGVMLNNRDYYKSWLEKKLEGIEDDQQKAEEFLMYLDGVIASLDGTFSELNPEDKEMVLESVTQEAEGMGVPIVEGSNRLVNYLEEGSEYLALNAMSVRELSLYAIDVYANYVCYLNNNSLARAPMNINLNGGQLNEGNIYDAAYWYSRNGNLNTLNRRDETGGAKSQTYSYFSNTNRLQQVAITGEASANYTYNGNGALTSDAKNGITSINYGAFNGMPIRKAESGGDATYRYDAAGMRTSKQMTATGDGYRYIGGLVVTDENGVPLRYNISDGYALRDASGNIDKFYELSDWLGTPRLGFDATGAVTTARDYYPYGKPMPGRFYSSAFEDRRYQFGGHEYDEENNHDYHGARYFQRDIGRYLSVDPLADLAPGWTPYRFGFDNPINFVDPTGMVENGSLDWVERDGAIVWDENVTSADDEDLQEGDRYLGKAVVVFEGSENEKLGKGNNLFGEGANLAKATVYGPGGVDDIKEYGAYTMSSDPSNYGTVADGEYTVYYDKIGKSGALKSNWAIEGRGKVPARNGVNPAFPNRNPGYLDGVFIHRSNNNGYAGGGVSKGCPLICPSYNNPNNGWDEFNQQLQGVTQFKMILIRDKK